MDNCQTKNIFLDNLFWFNKEKNNGYSSKIRFLCQQQGITVAELERRIGLSNGQITKWRRQVPGINKVQLVADYFDVSVDYLLGREKMNTLANKKMKKFASCIVELKI